MPTSHPSAAQWALITGAASGIGRALALEAARRQYAVALIDVDPEGLAQTVDMAKALGASARHLPADLRDRAAVQAAVERLLEPDDKVALVFANAGVLRAGPLWTMSADAVDLVIDVNIKGVINTLAATIPRLLRQATPSRIVATASVGALTAAPQLGVYSASKHALWALCESLQRDLLAERAPVAVTLLCPGAVATALADHDGPMATTMRERMAGEAALAPDQLARITFDALPDPGFWLFPQPHYLAPIRRRLQRVINQEDPVTRR